MNEGSSDAFGLVIGGSQFRFWCHRIADGCQPEGADVHTNQNESATCDEGSADVFVEQPHGQDDGEHGNELWISDGTIEGTRIVRDIRRGPGSSGN